MLDSIDEHLSLAIVDFKENTIAADANAVSVLAEKLLDAKWTWVE